MPVTIDGSNTPTAGGVGYGDGTELAFTSAGSAGQVLQSNGAGAPTWAAVPTVNLATGVTGTLPVANGGTGATSLTANNVLLGNGTSAVQVVAPSTSGNVLTSNGTTWTSAAPAAGGFSNLTVFTSSGTWSVPAGVTKCKVTVTGGGAGGSDYGGGSGATGIRIYNLSGGSATVTVGAAGAAGSNGGNSSFAYSGTTVTGGGGLNSPFGAPAAATNGNINISGGMGQMRCAQSGTNSGGVGGASYWGGGGSSQGNFNGGMPGVAFGSGGGGGGSNNNTGADGAPGIVVIEF